MMDSAKIVVSLAMLAFPAASRDVQKDGTCLLVKNSKQSRTVEQKHQQQLDAKFQYASFQSMALVHRNWRQLHQEKLENVSQSQDVLDKFIEDQMNSGTACSARLMESKRALDGLLGDVKALSKQVDSHEAVLETEAENLNITTLAIDAVNEEFAQDKKKCLQEREEAEKDLAQYHAELAELEQIADPTLRYKHVLRVDLSTPPPAAKLHANLTDKADAAPKPVAKAKAAKAEAAKDAVEEAAADAAGEALLQGQVWTKEQCIAFLEYARRHSGSAAPSDKTTDARSCDEKRKELQEEFTKAVKKIRELINTDAKERIKDETCSETASAKKSSAMVPLTSQREQAAARIQYANEAIAALDPVLALAREREEKLSNHVEDTLTKQCEDAGEVADELQKIRDLISDLKECPGRKDFTLKMPEEETTTPAPLQYEERVLVAVEGRHIAGWGGRKSLEQCKDECNARPKCKSFAFNQRQGACWLKDKCVTASEASTKSQAHLRFGWKTYYKPCLGV